MISYFLILISSLFYEFLLYEFLAFFASLYYSHEVIHQNKGRDTERFSKRIMKSDVSIGEIVFSAVNCDIFGDKTF